MTTVGYGDKKPNTILAKLYSVFWILIGMVMFNIITSVLTSEIIKANSPTIITMVVAKVGTLTFREYDRLFVAKNGDILVEHGGWDFYSDIFLLIRKLRNRKIDGNLFDRYTFSYITALLKYALKGEVEFFKKHNYDYWKAEMEFFKRDTMHTEKLYDGERLSYGILVGDANIYQHFSVAIDDNRFSV